MTIQANIAHSVGAPISSMLHVESTWRRATDAQRSATGDGFLINNHD
jgi:hypothetical protein